MNSNVQEIFNKVIDSGIYPTIEEFMCYALETALSSEVITRQELNVAEGEINKILTGSFISLSGMLYTKHPELRPNNYGDPNVEIYRNWELFKEYLHIKENSLTILDNRLHEIRKTLFECIE